MDERRKQPADDEIRVEIETGDAGQRLDKILAVKVERLSRAQIQALLRAGRVTDGAGATISDGSRRVKPQETYVVRVPETEPAEPAPEVMALPVVYEDDDVIVIDKPAHLVVHPAAGHASGTLVNALIAHCGDSLSGIGGVRRPGIVHRLDKGTSGLLVVAKNDLAHRGLAAQFAAHGADGRLARSYLALVWGKPLRPRGSVDAPLARSTVNRKKIAVSTSRDARHAVTHFEVLDTWGEGTAAAVSLVKLELETGRTHQIRVHMAHIGHPVLGDPVYGTGFKAKELKLPEPARNALHDLRRQALHAAELGFEHPVTGKPLHFTASLPDDMKRLLDAIAPQPPPVKRARQARVHSPKSR